MPPQVYVGRRPLQATQPVKRRTRPKLSAEANAEVRAQQRERSTAYNNALDNANKEINNIIENLAVSHKKSVRRVQSTLQMGRDKITNAQRTKSSAWNAFCWRKAKEMGDEHPEVSGRDVLKGVASYRDEYDAMTDDEKTELVREFDDFKATKQKGRRVSNTSKGKDVAHTFGRITNELENLRSRTGMETMLVSVRGSTDMTTDGLSFTTDGVSEFLPVGMGFDQQDFASRMEGFAFNGIRGVATNYKQRSNAVRKELRDIIQMKLVEETGDENARMHWSKYWEHVVSVHRVIIDGWPDNMAFANLSVVSKSLADLEYLLKRWKTGKTKWRRISDEEFEEKDNERLDQIDRGDIVGPRRRQTRSDKGVKRVGRSRRSKQNGPRASDNHGIEEEERIDRVSEHPQATDSNTGHNSADIESSSMGGLDSTTQLPSIAANTTETVQFNQHAGYNANSSALLTGNAHAWSDASLGSYDPTTDINFNDESFLRMLHEPLPTGLDFTPSNLDPSISDAELIGYLRGMGGIAGV